MIPRIKSIKPLEHYILHVVFDDGKDVLYNVEDDINTIPSYQDLKTIPGLFSQARLDQSRTCVYWNDLIDLPSGTIYEYGTNSYATLKSNGEYTIFEFNDHIIRFRTSDRLERYTRVVEWDHGYLVVMAKYKSIGEVEEYIDLSFILGKLYYDVDIFLDPIKEVRIEYAA